MTTIGVRLVELREELVAGERALAELDERRERLVASMLRISGAVQVLEELVAADPAGPFADPPTVAAGRGEPVPSGRDRTAEA